MQTHVALIIVAPFMLFSLSFLVAAIYYCFMPSTNDNLPVTDSITSPAPLFPVSDVVEFVDLALVSPPVRITYRSLAFVPSTATAISTVQNELDCAVSVFPNLVPLPIAVLPTSLRSDSSASGERRARVRVTSVTVPLNYELPAMTSPIWTIGQKHVTELMLAAESHDPEAIAWLKKLA